MCENPPTQLRTIKIPMDKGGDGENDPLAPKLGAWQNAIVVYEKTGSIYLYDVNGAYTNLTGTDYAAEVIELAAQLEQTNQNLANLQDALTAETTERQNADTELQGSINANTNAISAETTARENAITGLTSQVNQAIVTAESFATDIADEATAREAADNTLTTNLAAETSARETTDTNLQSQITKNTNDIETLQNAVGGDFPSLSKDVQFDTELSYDLSTITLTKYTGALNGDTPTETPLTFPVASSESAGIMNAATYSAVQTNAENVDAILNGAVALSDVPASPTQDELTDLWKTATNRDTLINRASIFDITNEKIWYYYDNDSTWHSVASGSGSEVTVSIATNDTPGIVQGSNTKGQVFVEADGTMSLNGWDSIPNKMVADITGFERGSSTSSALGFKYSVANLTTGETANTSRLVPAATTTVDGVMSAADKKKLNGLPAAIYVNSWLGPVSLNAGTGSSHAFAYNGAFSSDPSFFVQWVDTTDYAALGTAPVSPDKYPKLSIYGVDAEGFGLYATSTGTAWNNSGNSNYTGYASVMAIGVNN